MKTNYNYFALIVKRPLTARKTIELYVSDFKKAKKYIVDIQSQNTDPVVLFRVTDTYPPKTSFYIDKAWMDEHTFSMLLLTNRIFFKPLFT